MTTLPHRDSKGNYLPGYREPLQVGSMQLSAYSWLASPMTVRERTLIALIGALKDKTEWERKVFDETIAAKWRAEALGFSPDYRPRDTDGNLQSATGSPWGSSGSNGHNMNFDGQIRQKAISEKLIDFCLEELRENARTSMERGYTEAIDANACVYMSDSIIPNQLKRKLDTAVAKLENVRESEKDWHPGSDNQVLDLVHPSLFPLIYGRSRILPEGTVPLDDCSQYIGRGEIIPDPEKPANYSHFSTDYQWLPAELSYDENGKTKFTSYINNLHPRGNKDIYEAIEEIIDISVPMWIDTILSTRFLAPHRCHRDPSGDYVKKPDHLRPLQRRHNSDDEDFDNDDDGDREADGEDRENRARPRTPEDYDSDYDEHFEANVPEPGDFAPRKRVPKSFFENNSTSYRLLDIEDPLRDSSLIPGDDTLASGQVAYEAAAAELHATFRAKGLQVIVKLANIHLTPDNPIYKGGSWHVEGLANEHIIASALYYYNSDNISPSYLGFREGVDRDELNDYEQNRFNPILEMYGILEDWGDAVQVLGKVLTREGRLLTFPNVLQHRVSPFELGDKSRPGHRKLLALFLVDPEVRIISTAHVPPQRRDWWANALEEKQSLIQRLPVELADAVMQNVTDFPISMEDAKEIREKLMDERKARIDPDGHFGDNMYSFCEH